MAADVTVELKLMFGLRFGVVASNLAISLKVCNSVSFFKSAGKLNPILVRGQICHPPKEDVKCIPQCTWDFPYM